MGKRKYEGDREKVSKKSKDSQDVTMNEEEMEPSEKDKIPLKSLSFDIKHFRKELSSKQGQTMALTQFLQVCLNPDNDFDYIGEYLRIGGNSHEILRQINQENKKNLTLATPAFHIFHLIILKVQSSMPHMITITEEACRYFLNTFMPTLEIMISENSSPRHRMIILKLLTSMVTLNPDLGIEVLNQAPLTPKHLQYIVEKSDSKDKDKVRTAFVQFMTSFLVDGHLPLIKALLEKQGLLPLVIPGLIQDDSESVLMFLNILKTNVVDNTFISKSLKLKTFSHQVLHNLFKIFSWKGSSELNHEERNMSRNEIRELLSAVILTLFTSNKLGLYFVDGSLGTADANKNQNLYKALLSLKRPWDNEYECNVILEIVLKCPDLHRAIVSVVEQSFEPQHSPIWEKAIDFVLKLLVKLKPEVMITKMINLSPIQIANFVRFVTLPVPLLKLIQLNIGKDHTVSIYCAKLLVKMLQTLKRYIQILEMEPTVNVSDLKNKLEYFLPKHLPPPNAVVSLIQNIIAKKVATVTSQDYRLPNIDDTDALIYLIDLTLLYNNIHPEFSEAVEGIIDMKKILDFSMTLDSARVSLLKFKIVSLWLIMDSSAISLKNSMFKDLFHIMLDVYTHDENTWVDAKDTLRVFFKNTSIFEADEDEIDVILYTLRYSKLEDTLMIGNIVEYVLDHNKELTECVKNHAVKFEIADQVSEVSLDKLFKNLSENKNIEDTVFLETKTPSPFIVGCIQYMQNNKVAKKNLKHFLSLYVANLLHSNYSPELTEVFIGDSKLDARSYVASWLSKPNSIPDSIVEKDKVLQSISKSIIDDSDLALDKIFLHFKEVTDESDIVFNDVFYGIDLAVSVDSSELLIWAKYLFFCTIRLTNMGQMTETKQKKITEYLKCLLVIAKKHHMVDITRNVILNLFKNPHVLKIFSSLDVSKDANNILATKFILGVIRTNNDIVENLNKKHNILKSYQRKNFNELSKAFIKINKRKDLNSDHTIEVLKVIGSHKEDDITLFKQIFGVDIHCCYREDKEPSIVLEVLRVLVEKYSKSITMELPHGVLNKTMKLYTDLLNNSELVVNMANLETTLVDYFENKPHEVARVVEDNFKKIFSAKTIRKSTSQLVAVLLKYNLKFASIFKDQMSNPDIIVMRELTLPLGNAILEHDKFVFDNKDVLDAIYKEYKSNIVKLIEKPHKAGQIYMTCWKFIRKLILECMDIQDCERVFAKNHKFEAVEISHVQVYHAVFLKMFTSKDVKTSSTINYYTSMLNLTTIALKENKDADIINELLTNIYHAVKLVKIKEISMQDEELGKLTSSAVWQNFCKAVLKESLKVRTTDHSNVLGPKLLNLLTILVEEFYAVNTEDIVTLFDMVTSHSEFLNVMLSRHSIDVKAKLVEFVFTLIKKNKSIMKSQQIPVYLSAYHATRTACDRLILSILHYYESNGEAVNEYKPYLFGDSAANYYAVRKNRSSSLWAHPTPNQVLNLFEKDVIDRTVRNFPIADKLNYKFEMPCCLSILGDNIDDSKKGLLGITRLDKGSNFKDNEHAIYRVAKRVTYDDVVKKFKNVDLTSFSHIEDDESIYDPVFLFSLLSHLLAPGSMASCFKILRTGLLSVPVMALSSHCSMMRAVAYHILHRFCMLLETETRHKNDKFFLMDFINTLRQSLSTAIQNTAGDERIENLKNPRLPAVDALYLAKALMVSTAPFDPLYKPVNNFFIAKQYVDLTVVPDFLSLFHDSDVESSERRLWVLDIIRDGTKSMTDVNVIFKTMCLKMIMDFYSSVLSDRRARERIVGVLNAVASIPRASAILIEGYGLLSWLHCCVRLLGKGDRSLVKTMYNLIENILKSLNLNSFTRHLGKNSKLGDTLPELKVNKDVEQEILVILLELLPHMEDFEDEDFVAYVNVFKLLTKRTVKLLTKKQLTILLSCMSNVVRNNEINELLSKAVNINDPIMLKSVVFDNCKTVKLVNDLSSIVTTYLA